MQVQTHFVETCYVRACGAFLACDVRSQLQTFFSNNVRYENENALSFGVYYNSVAEKLSLETEKKYVCKRIIGKA